MGAPPEHRPLVRREHGAGPHAVGPGRRPLCRARVLGRSAWLTAADDARTLRMANNLPITARAVRLAPCNRIVASRMPTIHLFERVADPADWDALYELESRTNPRLRNEAGD